MSYKLRTTPAMELKLAKIKRFCEKQGIKEKKWQHHASGKRFQLLPRHCFVSLFWLLMSYFQFTWTFYFPFFIPQFYILLLVVKWTMWVIAHCKIAETSWGRKCTRGQRSKLTAERWRLEAWQFGTAVGWGEVMWCLHQVCSFVVTDGWLVQRSRATNQQEE